MGNMFAQMAAKNQAQGAADSAKEGLTTLTGGKSEKEVESANRQKDRNAEFEQKKKDRKSERRSSTASGRLTKKPTVKIHDIPCWATRALEIFFDKYLKTNVFALLARRRVGEARLKKCKMYFLSRNVSSNDSFSLYCSH